MQIYLKSSLLQPGLTLNLSKSSLKKQFQYNPIGPCVLKNINPLIYSSSFQRDSVQFPPANFCPTSRLYLPSIAQLITLGFFRLLEYGSLFTTSHTYQLCSQIGSLFPHHHFPPPKHCIPPEAFIDRCLQFFLTH